jgi:hypothetical protein
VGRGVYIEEEVMSLEMEIRIRCEGMLLVEQTIETCLDVFEQACEPRPPKPEWFGRGEKQWDSWWLIPKERTIFTDGGAGKLARNCVNLDCSRIESVVPVTRSGFPAPVGWGVVGE